MSISRRLAIWRLRWLLRIGLGASDAAIAAGLDNLGWRWAAAGRGDEMPDHLTRLASILPRETGRLVVRAGQGPRVPDGWWTEEPRSEESPR